MQIGCLTQSNELRNKVQTYVIVKVSLSYYVTSICSLCIEKQINNSRLFVTDVQTFYSIEEKVVRTFVFDMYLSVSDLYV